MKGMLYNVEHSEIYYRINVCGELNLFFFFQAEDGIRDHCVTGVQTCALPISPASRASAAATSWSAGTWRTSASRSGSGTAAWARSEERRVGKECRSRWSP